MKIITRDPIGEAELVRRTHREGFKKPGDTLELHAIYGRHLSLLQSTPEVLDIQSTLDGDSYTITFVTLEQWNVVDWTLEQVAEYLAGDSGRVLVWAHDYNCLYLGGF